MTKHNAILPTLISHCALRRARWAMTAGVLVAVLSSTSSFAQNAAQALQETRQAGAEAQALGIGYYDVSVRNSAVEIGLRSPGGDELGKLVIGDPSQTPTEINGVPVQNGKPSSEKEKMVRTVLSDSVLSDLHLVPDSGSTDDCWVVIILIYCDPDGCWYFEIWFCE